MSLTESNPLPKNRLKQSDAAHLSPKHRAMLYDESAIAPEIVEERGYYTARSRSEVPASFAGYQRRLGLVVPMFSPDGVTQGWQLRSDRPRKKGPKYETPSGVSPVVDVHPRMLEEARHGDGPLLITEGAKSGDAATSRGVCTVVLAGVWMWCVPKVKPYRLKPCFDHIRLEGREVLVAFDSDCMSKTSVQEALAALTTALEDRGAIVKVIYLPDATDGSKQGVDDYLAAGGTINELKMLAHKFDPKDFDRIRLSRNEELRVKVDAARSRWWGEDWGRIVGTGNRPHWIRGYSCRDAVKVALDVIARNGEAVDDGVRFTLSVREWASLASISKTTMLKVIPHLEAESWIRRDYGDKAEDAPGSYVLLTARPSLDQGGKRRGPEEKATQGLRVYGPGGQGLNVPRLRWSAPTFDREGNKVVRGYVRRLGKRCGAIIDVVEKVGLKMDINELAEALGVLRVSKLRRDLHELEKLGIMRVSDDTVILNPDWREALENERKLKGEIRNDQGEEGAEERDRARYRRESKAYREWLALSPEERKALKEQRVRARADGFIGDLRPADEPEGKPEPPPLSPLATAIRAYLDRSPRDASQPPGWIGSTLWAYDLYSEKTSPGEVRSAIAELGGESYRRSCQERAREVAA